MPSASRPELPKERGYLLSFALIGILVALLGLSLASGFELGPARPGPSDIFTGLYVMAWGFMFLAGYYFSHKSFFLRALMWVCEHQSSLRSRKMAFFVFALSFVLGLMGLLGGLGVL